MNQGLYQDNYLPFKLAETGEQNLLEKTPKPRSFDSYLCNTHEIMAKNYIHIATMIVMIGQWDSSLSVFPVARVQSSMIVEYFKGLFPG